jgi:hypothetical protein
MATTLARDAGINALCPPRRVDNDRLYAEWVLHVADDLPERDTFYLKIDLDGWDAWKAEATNVSAWLAS